MNPVWIGEKTQTDKQTNKKTSLKPVVALRNRFGKAWEVAHRCVTQSTASEHRSAEPQTWARPSWARGPAREAAAPAPSAPARASERPEAVETS